MGQVGVKTGMEPEKGEGVDEVIVEGAARGVGEVITEGEAQTVGGRHGRGTEACPWLKRGTCVPE